MHRVAMADGGGGGRTLGAVIREKDEELALFLEMRRRDKERAGAAADMLLAGDGEDPDGDGLLLLDPSPPPPPPVVPAGKDDELRRTLPIRPFRLPIGYCCRFSPLAKTLAHPRSGFMGAEPRAAPAPAYRMAGGFRRAPGGADDFLHSDAGDKSDYDW